MKTDTVFKHAFNDTLEFIEGLEQGAWLPTENAISERLGVSRTTVRKVLQALENRGVVGGGGRRRFVQRPVDGIARFPQAETVPMSTLCQPRFWVCLLRHDPRPAKTHNELARPRRWGVATTGIREFLNRFQRFGLIEKRPNSGWVFKGFTPAFASELFEIREMFEMRSAMAFTALPQDSAVWNQLTALREEHVALLREVDVRYHDFSDLDSRFHGVVNSAAPNRFIEDFYDIITLIFHYHYQWNKRDERQRNEAAIREHVDYIDALLSRDPGRIEHACRTHLASARTTLLRATSE